jgi:hypothetical protein|tara:strand:+ start:1959 stop:2096 length:138 start_codon:yes stop_codon:yes gene_type:complete
MTVIVSIDLAFEGDKVTDEQVYTYLEELMDDNSLCWDVVHKQEEN